MAHLQLSKEKKVMMEKITLMSLILIILYESMRSSLFVSENEIV